MDKVNVASIGFTQTTAQKFFYRLKNAGVKKVIDVRLHNTSQLAGFAKSDDLTYFLKEICGIEYHHAPALAPTDLMLKEFKKEKGEWSIYEDRFLSLMNERRIDEKFKPEQLENACLLCSEALPHHCHRRLVIDYLNDKWGGRLDVTHL
jgi:uncharacterized protein (DUF488 family)